MLYMKHKSGMRRWLYFGCPLSFFEIGPDQIFDHFMNLNMVSLTLFELIKVYNISW